MHISYIVNDKKLTAQEFLVLVQKVWPGDYDADEAENALEKTINITAWDSSLLVGCVRVLTDGYFFGTIPEVLVIPEYQGMGIGRKLMELAWDASPTSLFFGARPGNEVFFEKLGYERSMQSYVKKKSGRA